MFKLGPICMALLLALAVGGIGLLARLAVHNRPPAGTGKQTARVAGDEQGTSPAGSLREMLAQPEIIPTHHHPLLGRPAPDFALADAAGHVWNLRKLQASGPVVLIFFYGYHCKNCVRQLFAANDQLPLFREVGARVLAISADPPEWTRQRFQQYGSFGFPILSDPGNQVARAYQVFRADQLRHGTFVIDRQGMVQWVNVGDAPFRRPPALLYQLARLEGRFPLIQPGQ